MFCAGSAEVSVSIFHWNAVVCAWALRSLPAGTFPLGRRRWWRHRESWVRHSKTSEFSSTNTRNAYSSNTTGREIHVFFFFFFFFFFMASSCKQLCSSIPDSMLPLRDESCLRTQISIVVKLLTDESVKILPLRLVVGGLAVGGSGWSVSSIMKFV